MPSSQGLIRVESLRSLNATTNSTPNPLCPSPHEPALSDPRLSQHVADTLTALKPENALSSCAVALVAGRRMAIPVAIQPRNCRIVARNMKSSLRTESEKHPRLAISQPRAPQGLVLAAPNAPRVRGAGPARKPFTRRKTCPAPHPLQPIVRRPRRTPYQRCGRETTRVTSLFLILPEVYGSVEGHQAFRFSIRSAAARG